MLRAAQAWIAQGSKLDADSPRVAKLEVLPQNPVIPLPGMKQQMVVMATYTDGAVRDVTAEAFVESSNIEVTEADKPAWSPPFAAARRRCWPATKAPTPPRRSP